jgi:Type IV secretion-system coupling protein DNA-binding domain
MHTNHDYILGTLSTGESMPLLQADRRRHLYAVGQTGTGKTGFLTSLMHADLMAGAGFAFLDPHGDASQHIAGLTPKMRMNDVIYLDPSDPTHTFAYNPLTGVPEAERATVTANIVSAFKNIWSDSWGPRLEYILTNALRLLLDTRDQSLLGLPRLLVDDTYRAFLLKGCRDPVINAFWRMEYARYENRQRLEAIAPVQNKIGILLSNPFIRSILCQNTSTLDIPRIMNTGKVLIVNLSKGNLGTEPAHLLGALLITAYAQAAEGRRTIPEEQRQDFTLYVDEFQNFATDSFATILSEARKWRLSLVCANQQVSSQLPDSLRDAIFGNAGTLVAFRTGAQDAAFLADQLGMRNRLALTQTGNFHAWVRLMREGMPLEPKLLMTLRPPLAGERLEKVRALTRGRHMRSRAAVELHIEAFFPTAAARTSRQPFRRNPDSK